MENPVQQPAVDDSYGNQGGIDQDLVSAWGGELVAAVCDHCDWGYLLPQENMTERCPHCFQDSLVLMDKEFGELPYSRPPELVVPFNISSTTISNEVQAFAEGIPYAPDDLTASNLKRRLQRLYLPMWLVDVDVDAKWEAETGYDYRVVSHQERYDQDQGGWSSREVHEGRIRWEPRLGKLTRSYHNIPAPALEKGRRLMNTLGGYDMEDASVYQNQALADSIVRLPNRASDDAWSEAEPAVQAAAAEECRNASKADHIRQYRWDPVFQNQNWTLLLMPLYTTFYLDDDRLRQPVLINGQKGTIIGARRASMKRGQRTGLILVAAAIVAFMLSLMVSIASVLLPVLLVLGVIGFTAALLVGLAAIVPVGRVWWFNRGQAQRK